MTPNVSAVLLYKFHNYPSIFSFILKEKTKGEEEMKLTAIEKETVILWNEAENEVAIMTYDKTIITALRILAKENPAVKLKKLDCGGISTTLQKGDFEITFKNK